jgi:quercetin dioxygenase-like cupin family protein
MTPGQVTLGTLDAIDPDEPYPGLQRRTFDGVGMTVTEYRFAPLARFPLHKHPQEQATLIVDGDIEMTIAGELSHLSAGGWSIVPGGVEHGIRAGAQGARVVAIIVPRRQTAEAYTVVE